MSRGSYYISKLTSEAPAIKTKINKKMKVDQVITIKCQTLNSEKKIEEVDIEVPANIYDNIEHKNLARENTRLPFLLKSLDTRAEAWCGIIRFVSLGHKI